MTQACIIPLANLPRTTQDHLWGGAREAAQVWMDCVGLFQQALRERAPWPSRGRLQVATKGRYGLHSQTVQMVAKSVQTAFATTRQLRLSHPEMRMRGFVA